MNNCCLSVWLPLKPSLNIRTASAIFWIYLGIFRDSGLKNIFLRNKTFLFIKIESWNFQHLFELLTHSENCYFHFFYRLSDWIKILWGFTQLFCKEMLKVSAFYLEKHKSFIHKKIFFKLWLLTQSSVKVLASHTKYQEEFISNTIWVLKTWASFKNM